MKDFARMESDIRYDIWKYFIDQLKCYMLAVDINTPKFKEQHYFDRCVCGYDLIKIADIEIDTKTENIWKRIQYRHQKNICEF